MKAPSLIWLNELGTKIQRLEQLFSKSWLKNKSHLQTSICLMYTNSSMMALDLERHLLGMHALDIFRWIIVFSKRNLMVLR